MHEEILTESQKKLLSILKNFSDQFGLVGGTAIALQIGHRRSIDFDLFTPNEFDTEKIRNRIRKNFEISSTFVENKNELTIVVNQVKITFYKYPFDINYKNEFKDIIKLPDLLTLASMKAFALGKRAKWKDYVDLYFIFKKYSLKSVTKKTSEIFKGEFNERLLREQISYFDDIDYSERVDYLKGFNTEDEKIKRSLIETSLLE